MKAINYYIVVEKIKEPPKKVAGLELTEDQNKDMRYLKANVISTGNLVKGIKDGDLIYYDRHAGHSIEIDGNTYQVIKAQDVVVVL